LRKLFVLALTTAGTTKAGMIKMDLRCKPSLNTLATFGKKVLVVCIVVNAGGSSSQAQQVSSAKARPLEPAVKVLNTISAKSQNSVPYAILNKTQCVVVVPSAREARNAVARGVVACRETVDQWKRPALVVFTGHELRARNSALLVFVLSDRAARALQSGELKLGNENRGPTLLAQTSPIIKEAELTADLYIYELVGVVLSGSKATGVIVADTKGSDREQKHLSRISSDKYDSALVAFFNTIKPAGVVIHHTALIPGASRPPRSEREVDRYHQERGFEIQCSGRVYHVAYHYVIMANGTINAGRPERCQGAHAVGYNSYLGISLVGDFSSEDNPTGKKGPTKPTAAQLASLVKLCRHLRTKYNIPLQHIVRHSDISDTECPGDRFPFNAVLAELKPRKARARPS
jgi:N-acetylmuramoyl-L-alanine amidase